MYGLRVGSGARLDSGQPSAAHSRVEWTQKRIEAIGATCGQCVADRMPLGDREYRGDVIR